MSDDKKKSKDTKLSKFTENALYGSGITLSVLSAIELAKKFSEINKEKDMSLNKNWIVVPHTPVSEQIKNKKNIDKLENQEKTASMWDAAARNLGFLSGVGGTYWAANELLQDYKREQLKKRLEQTENYYRQNLRSLRELEQTGPIPKEEEKKEEEKTAGIFSEIGGAGLTGAALFAIASAYTTPKILDKYFPKLKKPTYDKKPTIHYEEIKAPPEEELTEEEKKNKELEEGLKEASHHNCLLGERKAEENLLRTVYSFKEASLSGIHDFVNAVACGKSDIIKEAASTSGDESFIFNSIKGSEPPEDSQKLAASFIKIAYDPELRNRILPYAVGEYIEHVPSVYAMGTSIPSTFEKFAYALISSEMDKIHREEFKNILPDSVSEKTASVMEVVDSNLNLSHQVCEEVDKIISNSTI